MIESPQASDKVRRLNFGAVATFLKDHRVDYLIFFLVGGGLIALDQWTKSLVRAGIPLGSDWLPEGLAWLMPYARIRHWYNTGAAFGIFQNGNLVFTILAIIVIVLILYYYPRTEKGDWWLRVAMSMQFAGAAGNLIDRLIYKHVTDFISVGNFAIFNIADASISTGVAVLLLGVWLKERAEKKKASAVASPENNISDSGNMEGFVPGKDEAKSG